QVMEPNPMLELQEEMHEDLSSYDFGYYVILDIAQHSRPSLSVPVLLRVTSSAPFRILTAPIRTPDHPSRLLTPSIRTPD
ncbi:hypothetical protein ACLOJK_023084, partial [Asimina triloba]